MFLFGFRVSLTRPSVGFYASVRPCPSVGFHYASVRWFPRPSVGFRYVFQFPLRPSVGFHYASIRRFPLLVNRFPLSVRRFPLRVRPSIGFFARSSVPLCIRSLVSTTRQPVDFCYASVLGHSIKNRTVRFKNRIVRCGSLFRLNFHVSESSLSASVISIYSVVPKCWLRLPTSTVVH